MVLKLDTLSCSNHDKIARATQADEQFQVLATVIFEDGQKTKAKFPVEAVPFWDYRVEISNLQWSLYRGRTRVYPERNENRTLKATTYVAI
ncbi:hypothetical protein DPMN_144367 [Dreissena polymorpha]|uniref:Uncharacterized protein n=1 Tax=Dreissena polymorpha TaxID=45954 RepID=A0A9D4GI21_DREPO|nr:hypothetical protein DPMN_144367 [Dreissena polymorpha]